MKRQGDIPFIHVARALAPLFVIWWHLGPWWCGAHVSTCARDDSPAGRAVGALIRQAQSLNENGGGHLGVCLFFLISGFIISHVLMAESRREFIIKRIFRIAPMLFIGVWFAFAVTHLLVSAGFPAALGTYRTGAGDALRSMLLLDTVTGRFPGTLSVTWSLVPEVGFYTLLAFVVLRAKKNPVVATLLILIAVAAAELTTTGVVPLQAAHYFFIYVNLILVGRAIYLGWSQATSWTTAAALGVAAFVSLTASCWADPLGHAALFSPQPIIFSWVFAIALFGTLLCFVQRCPAAVRLVSESSYSIYLLHLPIGCAVLSVLSLHYGVWILLSFPAAIVAVLLSSYLTYRLIEVPFRRLGRRLVRTEWPVCGLPSASV